MVEPVMDFFAITNLLIFIIWMRSFFMWNSDKLEKGKDGPPWQFLFSVGVIDSPLYSAWRYLEVESSMHGGNLQRGRESEWEGIKEIARFN